MTLATTDEKSSSTTTDSFETLSNTNSNYKKKYVLACDLDEVLGRFAKAVLEFHNATYNTTLTFKDIVSYDFHHVWGGTREEGIVKILRFFETEYFENIQPLEEAKEVLKRLKEKYELVVVTSRQLQLKESTKRWIEKYFPGYFSHIYMGNHYCQDSTFPVKSKSELCREADAVALIDDSVEYIKNVAPVVRVAILFNENDSYEWTKQASNELPQNCVRCTSWKEVENTLNSLAEKLYDEKQI